MKGSGRHLEIEAKYDLAPDDAVPILLGIAGTAAVHDEPVQVLTADYYDTEDLSLLRHGATLRRRSGGEDDGWHLKLAVGGDHRLEVRHPLGQRATVPAALSRLLVAVTGGLPLRPAATLVTHRAVHRLVGSDGSVLAEVADDVVTVDREGGRVQWRELELELVDGDEPVLAALDSAVRVAGVRRSAARSKIARVLADAAPARREQPWSKLRLADAERLLLREAAVAVRSADVLVRAGHPGAVEALVGALRQAAAVGSLPALSGRPAETAERRAALAWGLDLAVAGPRTESAAGQVRDLLAEQPPELVMGPVGRRLDREMAARRRGCSHALSDAMDSPRWLEMIALLDEGGSSGPPAEGRGPRLAKAVPDLTRRSTRRLERRLLELVGGADADLLPRARLSADTLLLVLDQARATGRREAIAPAVLRTGALLDAYESQVTALALLRDTAVAATLATESAFTFGRLHGLVDAGLHRTLRRLRRQRRRLRRVRRATS